MFNFDLKFFERNQKRLLKIVNSKWFRFLVGANRLPKEIKGLKIDKITPNSVHHNLEAKLTKKGKFKKQKVQAFFFTRPRFAEALAYNLSPFCYFQELKSQKFSWRFSPVGFAYLVLFGFLGKFAGLPFALIGTINSYYSTGGDSRIGMTSTVYLTARNSATGDRLDDGSGGYTTLNQRIVASTYYVFRLSMPINTSGLPDSAVVSAASLFIKTQTADNGSSDSYGIVLMSSMANESVAGIADYNKFGSTLLSSYIALSSFTTDALVEFALNETGIAAINKTGNTLLGVRLKNDIDAVAPTDNKCPQIYLSASGVTYDPYLEITYSVSTLLNLKTIDNVAKASIKTIDGVAIANIKSYNGLT